MVCVSKIEEQQRKALEEDPSAFDYDGVYDEMKAKTVKPKAQDRDERKVSFFFFFFPNLFCYSSKVEGIVMQWCLVVFGVGDSLKIVKPYCFLLCDLLFCH